MRPSIVILALAICSCAIDLEEPTIDPIYRPGCSNCDNNGLEPNAWKIAPFELSPVALQRVGLHDGVHVQPVCDPGTIVFSGGYVDCWLSPQWSAWAGTSVYRNALLKYIVKIGGGWDAASSGRDVVHGWIYGDLYGSFGLARGVLHSPWTTEDESYVTAGMAVATDEMFSGTSTIDICLRTATTPACPGSYQHQELAASGNVFANQREVVIGGHEALMPTDSKRVCPGAGSPCNTYQRIASYVDATCSYTGPMTQRYPTSCYDPDDPGDVRSYPVQVFMQVSPSTFGATGGGAAVPIL